MSINIGDKVLYGRVKGEVTGIRDEIALVRLEDGKEYSLSLDSIMPDNSPATKKSSLKRMDYLIGLAKEMHEAGIKELIIKNGEVTSFQADKSVEEIIEEKQQEEIKRHREAMMRIAEEVKSEPEKSEE